MTPIILLFVSATLEGVFTGPDALRNCWSVAATYEHDAACVPPASEAVPTLGLQMETSPRPRPRPEGLADG